MICVNPVLKKICYTSKRQVFWEDASKQFFHRIRTKVVEDRDGSHFSSLLSARTVEQHGSLLLSLLGDWGGVEARSGVLMREEGVPPMEYLCFRNLEPDQ